MELPSPRSRIPLDDARQRRRKFVMSDNRLFHPEPDDSGADKLLCELIQHNDEIRLMKRARSKS